MTDLAARLDSAQDKLLQALQSPDPWWQVLALAIAAVAACLAARALQRRLKPGGEEAATAPGTTLGTAVNRLALPTLLGIASLLALALLHELGLPAGILESAAVLAFALAGIRLLAELTKRVLEPGPLLAASEHLISWTIWAVVALYLLGWIGPVTQLLDSIAIPLGKSGFSLLDALRALVTIMLFTVGAAYLGSLATRRIMASPQLSIGLRVGVAKSVRFFLVLLAVLVALNAVGVDLAALTVFGGALGVGLGFGLQRIAANLISGFILIGDRSIRPGDVITIGNRFGVVKELRARYIVVQDRDGVDTLIPNENVISSEVINWSYGDRAIRLKLPVQISYADNPRQALELLIEAARRHPRVLKSPAAASRIMNFGDNGVELELRFWILDPEDGVNNVRSDLYLTIWDLFAEAGITIPFPQRDLHLREGWPGSAPRPSDGTPGSAE
jgi:small-conductance mechanosensitive channel